MTERDLEDIQLMGRVASGDQEAYAVLFDRHAPMILGLLTRMLGNRAEGEEVLQDVFLQVWQQAARYQPRLATPAGWLVMLARSRALDRLRSDRSRAKREDRIARDVPAGTSADGTGGLEADERRRAIVAAMASLTPEQRECLELAFFGGLTHTQIAAKLGAPLGTVKSRILSAMHKLRDVAAPYLT